MPYKGSCHCGGVAFEVDGELTMAVACNCSICTRTGALLWAVPRDRLRLLTPDDGIGTYTFNRHAISHRFCRTCRIQPFSDVLASEGRSSASLHFRSRAGVEPPSVPVVEFDGR